MPNPLVYRSVPAVLDALGLDVRTCPFRLLAHPSFPFLVPSEYVARMRTGDWHDPLLLQVLPRAEESEARDGFGEDPVGDRDASMAPGLLRKYRSRALVIATTACAIHCRYCFRRGLLSESRGRAAANVGRAIECLRGQTEIEEVILSGGDPLMIPERRLGAMIGRLLKVPHVKTLRVHTRVPVAMPSRVTAGVLRALSSAARRHACVVVIHANCAEEIDEACGAALARIRHTGAVLLNQCVLLRGVNDSLAAQERLARRLVANGVVPYYLHQLDRADGVWHFETPISSGKRLIAELRERLPGYAVPRYVREVRGSGCKQPL